MNWRLPVPGLRATDAVRGRGQFHRALDDLLRRRFTTFRTIYLPTAGRLAANGFELLPTAQRPHFTVRLRRADDQELGQLLEALGAPQPNPAYPGTAT